MNRANAYSGLGERQKALADYDKAIELDPGAALAYFNRGDEYRLLGDHERAIEDFETAVSLAQDPQVEAASRAWIESLKASE